MQPGAGAPSLTGRPSLGLRTELSARAGALPSPGGDSQASSGGVPSPISGGVSPGQLVSPAMGSGGEGGDDRGANIFRSSRSFKVLATERKSWSSAPGTLSNHLSNHQTSVSMTSLAPQLHPPAKAVVSAAAITSSPPSLTISAFSGAANIPPSPTFSDGSDGSGDGGSEPSSPPAWGRPVAAKSKLPSARSRFAS